MSHLLWATFLITSAVADHGAAAFVDGWHAALQGDRREAVLELMTTDVTGVETMVLRRVNGGWRIAHIHWSSRRVPLRTPPARSPGSAPFQPTPPSGRPMPPPAASAPARTPPREHLSADRLASQLQTAGLKVERKGSVRQPFFATPAKVLAIGADEIEVFEFASAEDAEKAAATVSADGGTIGTSAMHWMAPPHFHRRDRTILIHLGSTAKVRSAVERIAGAAFAGRR